MHWLRRMWHRTPRTLSDNPAFVLLLRTAQDDADFHALLVSLLHLPEFHRCSALNTMIDGMRLEGDDPDLIAALQALLDPTIAAKILELLEQHQA